MALDEAIASSVRREDSPPTLRLYTWDRPSVSLGCFQKVSDINSEYCKDADIPVARRPTGGRAILHNDELTYSFSVKTDNEIFSKGLLDSYRKISLAFDLAFRKIGVRAESKKNREKGKVLTRSPLCFQSSSFGEILIDDKKIVGSAQKRWSDGLLQQGSIPYSFEESLLKRIFRFHDAKDIKAKMTCLKDVIPELRDEEFRKAVQVSFENVFDIEFILDVPSEREASLAMELESEKYLSPEWNFRR
ncbi:MAG: lipoate--protein ligase family protein [Nitrospirae bacterium]|nr:lipoate--protein ligase family protein [Nitrospirota bacterium]